MPYPLRTVLRAGVLSLALAAPACAHMPCTAEVPVPVHPRLEPALVRRIEEDPERSVGVFVRTAQPPDERQRQALRDAGLGIGTVAGDVVSGRLRACDAVRVADLGFVRYLELARDVPVPPLPGSP